MVSKVVLDLTNSTAIAKAEDKIERMRRYYRDRKGFLDDVRLRLKRKYVQKMLRELRDVPPRRRYPDDYPVEFVSDKQRRYVMSLLNGKPYRRTNKIVNAWEIRLKNERGKITLQVNNTAKEHIYVVGSAGFGVSKRSLSRYTSKIQPFHSRTGWKPAYEIVQKYKDAMEEEVSEVTSEWLQKGFR